MDWKSIYSLIFIALLSSCQMEIEEGASAPEFRAEFESEPTTKTSLSVDESGAGTIYWTPSDQIDVFFGSTRAHYTSQNTEIAASTIFKTNDAIGSPEIFSTNIWGLYPSYSSSTCDGSSVTTVLPSVQYGVPETFDDDLFVSVAHTSNSSLQFYNVCGGIKFSLSRDDITSVSFRGNDGEDLAGEISVTFVNGLPKATVLNGVKEVTLTPKTGQTFAMDVNYYLIVLPGTLSKGFTMTFTTSSGFAGVLDYTEKSITIKRSIFSRKAKIDSYAKFEDAPSNKIIYTSTDGKIIMTYAVFGAKIVSNEYINGQGVITFDGPVTEIGSRAFDECSRLETITLPSGVTSIGDSAFSGCNSLASISIPSGVTSIGDSAFSGCSSLETISIPSGVTSIGDSAFSGCRSLETISIPSGVTSIGDSAFSGCRSLETISIPSGVTSIGYGTFNECSSLTSISIPSSVTSIGNHAFYECICLASITIPSGVTSIGGAAFYRCSSLKTITIPSSVTSIGNYVFSGCSSLAYIELEAELPPSGGSNMFNDTNNCPIYVPAGSVGAYKSAQYWSDYADRIKAVSTSPVPDAIDLGLPSGLKWASFNIGASAPEEYGDYYAWGETETKNDYNWATYMWGNDFFTKYNTKSDFGVVDNKTVLDTEDDVAHVKLGGNWRMPTDAEWTELREYCTWTWTTQNGINGRLVTGKNGKSIFIPVTGFWFDTTLYYVGNGHYWSSSLNTYGERESECAWSVYFNSRGVYRDFLARAAGQSIRPVYDDAVHPESVAINKSSLSLIVGSNEQLTATVSPANAKDKTVTWYSSNTSVATVSSSGVVTAKAAGSATITVTTNNGGKKATCSVTVKEQIIPVTGVSLDKTSMTMTVGDTQTLTASVTPSNATDKSVAWSSSNTSIATVSSSGVVTAKAAGIATITARTNDGGKNATCSVNVEKSSTGTLNGYNYVEMGDGLKWATMNVGASSDTDFGDYFAWGETETYYTSLSPLTWKNGHNGYGYYYWEYFDSPNDRDTYIIYNNSGGKTKLEARHDAATSNWGSTWRMPTKAEWVALLNTDNYSWDWDSARKGYIVTSNVKGYEGNSIFLPAAGYLGSTGVRYYSSEQGRYWSSSLSDKDAYAGVLSFATNSVIPYLNDHGPRHSGYSIRAVSK